MQSTTCASACRIIPLAMMDLNTALRKVTTGRGPSNAAEGSLPETVKSLEESTTRKRIRNAAFA